MYHFSKCRVHSLALLRHLVIFNLSRFSLFLYLFRLRNLIKSHFPTSPSPSNLNVKLTMAFSSYLSFPLVRMLLTSHSFMKRPLPCLISRPLKCWSVLDFCLTCLPVLGLSGTKPSEFFTLLLGY